MRHLMDKDKKKRWQSVTVSLIIIVLITAFVAPKPSFAAAGEVSIQGIPTEELFGAIDVKDSELVGTDAFKARISSNETYVEFNNQDKSYWIKSVPVGFKKVRGRTQREIITFEGVMDGVTLKEKLYEGKTKEEIWLLSRESPTSFMFVLSHSDNLILKKDGEDILLSEINSNKEMGRIESPFAVDAKGTRYRYTYTLKGNTLVLEPVSSLDGAIYPLVIDPSYTIVTGAAEDFNVTAYSSQRKFARSANGDLHAVYHRLVTVNNIYYAKSTDGGQTWTETALTSETGAGYDQYNPAIAVDSKNYLHVAWRGTNSSWPTNPQLKYRKYTTSWQPIENLTSEGYIQNFPSIAVDSNDNLHVTWYGSYCDPSTNYQIRYIKYDSALGAWQIIQNLTSDPTYLQVLPSIAVDSNNNLHIIWHGTHTGSKTYYQIRYIKYDSALGAWQTIQNLTNEGYTQQRPQIAIDSNDNLHVAWSGQHGGSANGISFIQIRYIKYDGAWQTIQNLTDEGCIQQWSSIAVDSHNYIHIVWFGFHSVSPTYYQIRYIEYTTSWQPIQNLTAATVSQRHPNTFWARWPRISGVLTNRPHDGYAFIWADGATVIKYYCSSDLSWDIAGGLLSYGSTTSGQLGQKYQTWGIGNIPQWGGENSGPVSNVTTNWTVLKASPANPGVYVMAMVTTEASNNFKVYSYYNGTWTSEFTAIQSSTQDDYRLFDVAFENSSGHVLVVYGKTGSNTVYYREGTWNGSNFGLSGASEGSFTFNTSYLSGNTRWLILSNRLNSDQMILLTVSDQTVSGNNISAAIWDGSSFGNQNSTGWGLVYTNTNWDFDCAYETASGEGMVAWGVSASPYWKYATYVGSTWTINNGPTTNLDGPIRVLALDGDPTSTSNRIAAGIIEDAQSDDVDGAVWDGSSWTSVSSLDTAVYSTALGREVDVKYAGTSGNAILVYNDTKTGDLSWARSVDGAAFSLQTEVSISGEFDSNIQLVSDASGSNKVMLVILDSNSDLYAYYYTVASNTWTATNSGNALEADSSGGTSNESYMFAYESVFPTVVTLNSFTARGSGNSVKVEWETKTEIDNLGFNLYRSTERNGTYTKLNSSLIPGLLSSVTGRRYSYADTNVIRGTLYYYKLEDIDLNGTRTVHGPVCVDWDADGIPDDEDPDIVLSDTDSEESSSGSGGDLTDYKGGIVTHVELQWLRAHRTKDGIKVEWKTGYEVDNLGFHVYREENGELYRLTPELIAGSALLAGSGTALTAGRHYTWWDFLPEETGQVQYWLEDVDLNGKRTMHGPVTPVISQEPLPEKVKPEFLSEFGMRVKEKYRDFWRIQKLKERLPATNDRGALRSRSASLEEGSILEARGASPQGNKVPAPLASRPKAALQAQQWFLAGRPAVKILVKEEGWYRVSQSELVAAGFNSRVNPRYLQLFADGEEQPILVKGEKDGRFDLQDAIEFYGVGLDTPSTDKRVYWLVAGSRAGKRIQLSQGQGGQLASSSFPYTAEKKDRMIYFAALKNGDEDNFFGPVITAEPVDQLMSVLHLSPAPPGEAMLEVALQGATNVPHRVKVLLNETEVGEVVFDGQSPGTAGFTIPQALLLEGDNLVSLIAQGGEMDVSVVDYIRLTYWHTYTADEDTLKFTAQGGNQLSINGFSNLKIRVIDITNPGTLLEVAGKVNPQGLGYSVTFKVPGSGQRTLLALTEARVKNPAGIVANRPSSWHQSSGYDFVIIAHRDFFENIEPLKKLRQSQGLSVALIDVEDLYDEFNFGAKSPKALIDFLSLKKQWGKPPRFLLLVGDASFDPRNYLGFGDLDFVPTKLIDTSYLETASDDWFVDFNGDKLPEMAVGRLPVRTTEEANTVVSKITGYEQSAPIMEALLVADKNDEFNFEAATEEVGALLQPHVSIREIFRGNFSSNAAAKAELLSSIDQGPLFVNYTGHGSVEIWRGNILTSDDAEGLINGLRLPFFVSMTCLNGFFHDLYTESLAEALLKAKNGGAMAVWASSGLTEPDGQNLMDKELIRLLFNDKSLTIGEATAKAKASVSDQDIRRTWILFGDPTTRLK